ncbi:hypothetical protein [Aquiflexum gelatinilyticum]|uniref:Uncharacterized protein n=1 Tax=Aquiflexum gelatinilyticum TaxID=2961943 RepID=A0A9X2P9B5_9BACT|nr:hypothetical protein [Aquiflexum gelatinilyticum]MCR9017236.1 hypothetical protein [Aquiflexum gelatinilyticum]
MTHSFFSFFRIQVFLILLSSSAFGQDYIFPEIIPMSPGLKIDVIPGEDFVLSYVMDANQGILTLTIKDGEFNQKHLEQYSIGRGLNKVNHEVNGEKVYLLLSNEGPSKTLAVINTLNSEVQFFPFSINLGKIDQFKVNGNTLLMIEYLPQGDLIQFYDFQTEMLITLSEFTFPKTSIWDVQVKDGIFDILVYKKGKFRSQSLMMIGFNDSGSKLFETEISLPGKKKYIFRSAKLIPSQETGYSIVGTYSRKQGEQFSGYYHVGINDGLEQNATIHPMRSLDGFFDYKKNPGLRINTNNFRRNMQVYQTYANRKYIALATSSDNVPKEFVHFILVGHNGERVYDTALKVLYELGGSFSYSTLALNGKELYFIFEGNSNINVFPSFKFYQMKNGQLTRILKDQNYLEEKSKDPEWIEIKYYHWKENKFIVSGIETINGQKRHVIRKIEI